MAKLSQCEGTEQQKNDIPKDGTTGPLLENSVVQVVHEEDVNVTETGDDGTTGPVFGDSMVKLVKDDNVTGTRDDGTMSKAEIQLEKSPEEIRKEKSSTNPGKHRLKGAQEQISPASKRGHVKWLSVGVVLIAVLAKSGVMGSDPGGNKSGAGNNCTVGTEAECPKLSSFESGDTRYGESVTLGFIPGNPRLSLLRVDIYGAAQPFSCSTAANASHQHTCSLPLWEQDITVCKGFSLEPMGDKSIIKYSNVTRPLYFCVYVAAPNYYHISQYGFYIKDTPEITTRTSSNQSTATSGTTTTPTQDPKSDGKIAGSWKPIGITVTAATSFFILICLIMYCKGWRCFKASEYNLAAGDKEGGSEGNATCQDHRILPCC